MCYNTNITVKNPDTETTLDLRPPIWIDLKKHLKINFKTAKLHIFLKYTTATVLHVKPLYHTV